MDITSSNISEVIGGTLEYVGKTDILNVKKLGFWKNKTVLSYSGNDVKNFKVMDPSVQKVSSKGTAGTLTGAAIGGVLTGGVGAIVGGMAGGNKIETFSSTELAFEFNDGNWVVIKFANTNEDEFVGRVNNLTINLLKKRFAQSLVNPFN
jgi:hypothetical protein